MDSLDFMALFWINGVFLEFSGLVLDFKDSRAKGFSGLFWTLGICLGFLGMRREFWDFLRVFGILGIFGTF